MKKNIDDLVREKLSGHKTKASKFLWYRIVFRRFLQTFFGKTLLYVLPVLVIAYLIPRVSSPAASISTSPQEESEQLAYFRDAGNEYANDSRTTHKPGNIEEKEITNTKESEHKDKSEQAIVRKEAKIATPGRNTHRSKAHPNSRAKAKRGINNEILKSREAPEKPSEKLLKIENKSLTTNQNQLSELSALKRKISKVRRKRSYENQKCNVKRPIDLPPGLFHKNRNMEINFYFNPAITKTRFEKNDEFQKHISVRRKAENDFSSYSGGFSIRKYYRKKYFGELGMDLTLMNNRVQYHTSNKFYDPENSYYIIDTTWVLFINEGHWDSIPQIDSTFYPVYVDRVLDKNVRQKYQYISLPVLGGMSFRHKNLEIDAAVGFSIGWINTIEGEMLNYDNKHFVALPKVTQSIMIQHIAKVRIAYEISDKTFLYIAPQYRIQLNTLNAEDYPIHSRFINYGISTGIALKL